MIDRLSGHGATGIRPLYGVLLGWLLLSTGTALAQLTPLRLTVDSLSRQRDFSGYLLYPHPWQFHVGDDARWASPQVDDWDWQPYRTGFVGADTPPDWKGIGWFRLHFTVDSALIGQRLALRIAHVGASEVYVDGRKVGGFGQIGSSPTAGSDYFPFHEPVVFELDRPGQHVLAIRVATYRQYLTRRVRYGQGFLSWIALSDRMTQSLIISARSNGLNLVLVFGPGLFALLHLFLFLFYPARTSNLYYSVWLTFFTAAAVCVYFDDIVTSPATLQTIAYGFGLTTLGFSVASVAFIYSVCYPRQPRQLGVFVALGLLLAGVLLLFPVLDGQTLTFVFFSICTLEVMRVVFLSIRRGQPGVWLIGVGLLAVAVAIFVGSIDALGLWQRLGLGLDNPYGEYLFVTFSYLTLPLCTSLYLAQDFARTNLNLEAQLGQVEELSAKTRAQEAEKLHLVAQQNEVLEQTVQERTEKIQQQADKLREMDAVKSRFFTNLAHEFRTPLTLMLGPAEQVLAQTGEARTKQQVGLLQRNAQRLLQLVNQLLDLSKLDAGKMALTPTSGDMISLVRGTLRSFESLAKQKQISLHVETDLERLVMDMDRDKLDKILSNLLSNALKFTRSRGDVWVSLTQEVVAEESWFQLVVRDTGVGIPAAKLPFVFDQFYQVDASNTREQEGFGIGLALTKELVELHGGTIHIDSPPGVGTIVTLRLPIRQEQPPEDGVEPDIPMANGEVTSLPALFPQSPEAAQLLLIEDNHEVRQFIRLSLTDQYRIMEAANGEEGIQLAQQHVPDLVITDLMMPKLDGYGVCQALKQDERTSHIPIVMLTAKADLDSRIEGLQTGADSYLAKPFHQRELLAQIANLIATRRQLQERYRRWGVLGQHTTRLSSLEAVFLGRVRTVINQHIADEQFSVEMLSREVGISRMQLHRKLTALLDLSPGDLIRQIRLELAHELLRNHVATVAEVAYQVGFGNPANFSTSFSRQFGYAPSEVRQQSLTSSARKAD